MLRLSPNLDAVLRTLLCVASLLATEAGHGWMHDRVSPDASSGQLEIHDGHCEHRPDHEAGEHDCLLCGGDRKSCLAVGLQVVARTVLEQLGQHASAARSTHQAQAPTSLLGARAPPRLG